MIGGRAGDPVYCAPEVWLTQLARIDPAHAVLLWVAVKAHIPMDLIAGGAAGAAPAGAATPLFAQRVTYLEALVFVRYFDFVCY